MAPEMVVKWNYKEVFEYDPFKCDMWSLGVTFYHLLTNELPFDATNPKEMIEKLWDSNLNYTPLGESFS